MKKLKQIPFNPKTLSTPKTTYPHKIPKMLKMEQTPNLQQKFKDNQHIQYLSLYNNVLKQKIHKQKNTKRGLRFKPQLIAKKDNFKVLPVENVKTKTELRLLKQKRMLRRGMSMCAIFDKKRNEGFGSPSLA